MNVEHLRELEELFEYRKDALILLCLASGVTEADGRALHFGELARTIVKQSGAYIPDGTISRSLPRLKDSQLVAVVDQGGRHPSYHPTALGERKAATLRFILDALEEWRKEQTAERGGSKT